MRSEHSAMTIRERREIEFDANAIVTAIAVSSKAAQSFGLPGTPPIEVRFRPHDGEIDVVFGTTNAPMSIPIASEQLGALLLSYCIRTRIPMPKVTNKGIRIEAHCAVLAFKTVSIEEAAPAIAEARIGPSGPVTAWTWLQPNRAQ
jgi:hypothetical protein